MDHRLHLIGTIATLGLWGIGWFYFHKRDQRRSWRCAICLGRQRPPKEKVETQEAESPEPISAIPLAPRR